MEKLTILAFVFFLTTSCLSTKTNDSEKAYKYWAGTEHPKDMTLIEGEYYQSPHFTLEYEFFLKFKPTKKWWNEFIEYNNLEIDSQDKKWSNEVKLPNWFKSNDKFIIYSKNDMLDSSRYLINLETGICYIYETVGM
jgi:hypothetical protein